MDNMHPHSKGSASAIYQDFLDRVTRAVWVGDDLTVADAMVYPNTMETTDGVVVLENAAAMMDCAAGFRESLLRMGATEYHRICKSASFNGTRDQIEGTHVTYVMAGGSLAIPAFGNRMWLVKLNDRWMGTRISAEVLNRDCTILGPDAVRKTSTSQTSEGA